MEPSDGPTTAAPVGADVEEIATPSPPGETPSPPDRALGRSRTAQARESLRELGRWIRDHYLTLDLRTLGAFRLALGFLLVGDCVRHWREARTFYSNDGVLTNHYHLYRPSSGYNFSAFHAFSTLGEVHVAFALAFICFFLFLIGWHTRLFSILSFVIVTSLDNRLVLVENGGYVVVNLLVGWAMFMPTGRRFSIDAMVRSYRDRIEQSAEDLNNRTRPADETEPFVSLVALLVLLNLATIYFFNVVNKSGSIWRHGDTVHYVLWLNRMVTGLAVFLRNHLPYWSTRGLTWAVIAVEAMLVPWILAPYGRRWTRTLAIVTMWCLHASFGILMRLGPFSWFLLGWSFLLLTPAQWEGLEAWYRRRAEPRVVVYDRGSALAFAFARFLARLDVLALLTFAASEAAGGELVEVRDTDGRAFTGRAALRQIMQALPAGRWLGPLFEVATLGASGTIFAVMGRRRTELARFFGLSLPPIPRRPLVAPAPLTLRARRARRVLREVFLTYLALCAVSQVVNENKSVPALLKHKQPKFVEATIGYPRIYQGWGMFAPNPIQDDGSLTVDARTLGGRRVDPFTGAEPDLDLTDAQGLGLGQIRQDYFNRIRLDRNAVFRQGLREYLLNYQNETGRAEDELVAFDVYWVRDQCPPPGGSKPSKNETIALLTYRKPGYKPPPDQPPLAPEPKVESAGN